ncbi:MAG: RnfABCDGE type electron transport complex subunit D, partial [Treponema sp.]|nr:RnfABCDGE type electron transport complex subunit D [Treponema sp.]
GKILYGLLSGIIAFILVGSGQSTIGLMFTILLINILSPLLQLFEESLYKRKLKSLILNKE